MKYSGANFALLLVDGYDLRASITENASMGEETVTQQSNPFGIANEEHTPIGIQRGTLVAGGGLYDLVTDALHGALADVTGISRIICAAIATSAIGKMFWGFAGAYSQKYEMQDQRDGLVKANVTYLVSGAVDVGQIIDYATYTANWDTKTGGVGAPDAPVDHVAYTGNRSRKITNISVANPTVITTEGPHGFASGQTVVISGSNSTPTVNGSRVATSTGANTFTVPVTVTVQGTQGEVVAGNTTQGGVGYLQVSAFSGFTSVTPIIKHSPDDVTYANLVSFTAVTAAPPNVNTKQRVAVAGNVDRYLCSTGTVVGSGSVTLFMGFCRNY
jgi:hypothetical protein